MKHKKQLLILFLCISILIISILILLFALGKFENSNPLYGEFIYINDDGSNAKIVLNEKSVYFENVNYDSIEEITATYLAIDELNQKDKNYTKDILEKSRKKYLEQLNFESYYDQKTISIDETLYIKEEQQYYYYLYYPKIGDNGIDICVDLKEKSLSIGDMEFQYEN